MKSYRLVPQNFGRFSESNRIKQKETVYLLLRITILNYSRLYILVSCSPFMVIIPIASIYISAYYLIFYPQPHFVIDILETLINFSSQQIRHTLLIFIAERIIATIFLERYILASKIILFVCLTVFSYSATAFYMILIYYCKFSRWRILG